MSTTIKKRIYGYDVTLVTGIDDDPTTQCWVEKGKYTGSLSMLTMSGELDGPTASRAVPDRVVGAIEEWALNNGW